MKKENFIIVFITLIIVTISVSIAYFAAKLIGTEKNVHFLMEDLALEFSDDSSELNIEGIEPGWTYEKTFTIENKGDSVFNYNIIFKDFINTFMTTGLLQYKITDIGENSEFTMNEFSDVPKSASSATGILAYNINISSGEKHIYKLELRYLNSQNDQSIDSGKKFHGYVYVSEGTDYYARYEEGTLGYKIMTDNPYRVTRTNFDVLPFNNTNNHLFLATETNFSNQTNYIYYFAGNTTNNWVKFGKNSNNEDLYWRIVRTTFDGSIKLLYQGINIDGSQSYIATSAYNTSYSKPYNAGYMYKETDGQSELHINTINSTIKEKLDNWFLNNLTNYQKYMSTTSVYCNDRSASKYSENSNFDFDVLTRLYKNPSPTFNCLNINDSFSVDNENAKLTYPISLITADEISYAGGKMSTSVQSYFNLNAKQELSSDKPWWTMSPNVWFSSGNTRVFNVTSNGTLSSHVVNNNSNGIRPVISLKSCVKYSSGDGTPSNPYTILESESGC